MTKFYLLSYGTKKNPSCNELHTNARRCYDQLEEHNLGPDYMKKTSRLARTGRSTRSRSYVQTIDQSMMI